MILNQDDINSLVSAGFSDVDAVSYLKTGLPVSPLITVINSYRNEPLSLNPFEPTEQDIIDNILAKRKIKLLHK